MVALFVLGLGLLLQVDQILFVGNDLTLVADESADARLERPLREVLDRLGAVDLGDATVDAHLARHDVPVEAEAGARVLGELAALLASVVSEEGEAGVREVLEQDHATRRLAVQRARRYAHGVGLLDGGVLARQLKPAVELLDRILGLEVFDVEDLGRIAVVCANICTKYLK